MYTLHVIVLLYIIFQFRGQANLAFFGVRYWHVCMSLQSVRVFAIKNYYLSIGI